MREQPYPPFNVRRGRFLWLAESEKKNYVVTLKEKIAEGYFFREAILRQLAEDLAPIYVESTGAD